MKSIAALLLLVLIIANSATPALAHHKERVLGESTAAADIVFPPVTSGPGFILPDSPFYFLDQTKQRAKLIFAFSEDKKAKLHTEIAGERLAELRIMLEREHEDGITEALNQLTREQQLAAESLSDAASQGKNVQDLAKSINTEIKSQREILQNAAEQTNGKLEQKFLLAHIALKEAKLEVEDNLPEDEFEKEIEESLEDEIDLELMHADESSRRLLRALEVLEEQASRAAESNNEKRLGALQRAIENKNETLMRLEEKRIQNEERKEEQLTKERQQASESAEDAALKLQEAITEYKKAHSKVVELKNTNPEDVKTEEPQRPARPNERKPVANEDEEN